MKSFEIKKELHHYIDEADEPILNILHDVVAEYVSKRRKIIEPIKPMTKDDYLIMINKATEEVKRGEVLTEKEVSAHLKKKYEGQL